MWFVNGERLSGSNCNATLHRKAFQVTQRSFPFPTLNPTQVCIYTMGYSTPLNENLKFICYWISNYILQAPNFSSWLRVLLTPVLLTELRIDSTILHSHYFDTRFTNLRPIRPSSFLSQLVEKQLKNCSVCDKMPTSLFIVKLEIAVAEESYCNSLDYNWTEPNCYEISRLVSIFPCHLATWFIFIPTPFYSLIRTIYHRTVIYLFI